MRTGIVILTFGLLLLFTGNVFALETLVDNVSKIEELATVTIGIPLAVIAIVGVGVMCFMGRIPWGAFSSVIVGCSLIIGAAGTVEWLQ